MISLIKNGKLRAHGNERQESLPMNDRDYFGWLVGKVGASHGLDIISVNAVNTLLAQIANYSIEQYIVLVYRIRNSCLHEYLRD
jgi:hypothetical protein